MVTLQNVLVGVFVLVLVLSGACSLRPCTGTYELPTFGDVKVTRNLDWKPGEVQKVDVYFELTSKVPVAIDWFYKKLAIMSKARKNNPALKSTAKKTGNMYVFKLHLEHKENITNLNMMTNDIWIDMVISHKCNAIRMFMALSTFIKISKGSFKLPSIVALPKKMYVTGAQGPFSLRFGFSTSESTTARGSRFYCRKSLERQAGKLTPVYLNDKSVKFGVNTTIDLIEAKCSFPVANDTEADFIRLDMSVRLSRTKSKIETGVSVNMYTNVEIRRQGVVTPAISVMADMEVKSAESGDELLLATGVNKTTIAVIGDAGRPPWLALAKFGENQHEFDIIKPLELLSQRYFPTLTIATFEVTVPEFTEENRYICSASSGAEVVSKKFRIVRYQEALLKHKFTKHIRPKLTQAVKPLNVSCEATGSPQPTIDFYWSPRFFNRYYSRLALDEFINVNSNRRMNDSDIFQMTSFVKDGVTHASLVSNTGDVLRSLSSDYWRTFWRYDIVCFASNSFSYDSQTLVSIYDPDDF